MISYIVGYISPCIHVAGITSCTLTAQFVVFLKEEFEDTKGLSESVYRRRTDNTNAKRKSTKGQTTIYKTYT